MRLWHKDLISVLPKAQLVAQWRECSAIAGAIIKNGTPNHLLVNLVLEYDFSHFIQYSWLIRGEMMKRGYRTMDSVMKKIESLAHGDLNLTYEEIYQNWHDNRYFKQCYYNLQEKFDCNGMSLEEWKQIELIGVNKFGNEKL